MITRNHITFEETVGEYVVSLHLPLGLSFGAAIQIVENMKASIEAWAQKAAAEAQVAAQPAQADQPAPDVTQPDQVESVTQA